MHVSFSVDGTPIREFKNAESIGVPFRKNRAMRIYSSLWNADDWATRGGLDNDWSQAPFTASYRNFNAQACIWSSGASSCASTSSLSGQRLALTGAGFIKPRKIELGAEDLRDLQLLHRFEAIPTGSSS
ncbi:hypothetical protein MRB53_013251 [Persea americana]|uniref:Uncharacterized protein n=1 Tax=Persea americana TaxID=3435 RepID=A0ACC2K7F3_PERAE|nr:hypothetical protein MRB53_013251 [Persea americana]